MYADDTKLMKVVENDEDRASLQSDLDEIVKWAQTWLMELNVKKCKVMHVNSGTMTFDYYMDEINHNGTANRVILDVTNSEKDLGILINENLKYNQQCNIAANKANNMLGILKNTFVSRDTYTWKKLYTIYIRPHLEFAIQAWNPYLVSDIKKLKRYNTKPRKFHKLYEIKTTKLDAKL